MRNLIPEFLADDSAPHGSFADVGCIFLDLSGFTAMSSQLSPHGKRGAEELSAIINRVFAPLVEQVYRDGGIISSFAGDACAAVFPGQSPEAVATTATRLQSLVRRQQLQRSELGEFSLEATIGIGWGDISWHTEAVADAFDYLYIHGSALRTAAAAAGRAQPGWIVLHNSVDTPLATTQLDEDYARVTGSPGGSPSAGDAMTSATQSGAAADAASTSAAQGGPGAMSAAPASDTLARVALPVELQQRFRPLQQLPDSQSGEFRTISCIFASLPYACGDDAVYRFAAAASRAAARYGGYLDLIDCSDKGPLALILFGAPRAYRSDVRHALECAAELAASHTAAVGITRGTVYTGYIGDAQRATYSAIGSAVNLAARIAMSAEPGEVLTPGPGGFSAIEAGLSGWDFVRVGERQFKGIPGEQTIGRVVDQLADSGATVTTLPVYGRDEELSRAIETIRRSTTTASGSGILVEGEAGMGKTSLARRISAAVSDSVDSIHLYADPILQKSLNPFPLLIRTRLRQQDLEVPTPESTDPAAPLVGLLSQLIPEEHVGRDLLIARAVPALLALLGIPYADPDYDALDSQAHFEWTMTALQEMLAASTLQRPCLLIIDDAEELDSDSLNLLSRLSNTAVRHPLSILLLLRSDTSQNLPGFAPDFPVVTITLPPLPRSAVEQIAVDTVGGPVATKLLDYIEYTVGRHPLFVAELTRQLLHSRLLYRSSTGYTLQDAAARAPQSITALYTEKVDELPPETAAAAKIAAVMGREFDTRVLDVLIPESGRRVWDEGIREGIWHPQDGSLYRFAHAPLQQALIEMQFDGAVRTLHGRIADAIAAAYPDSPLYLYDRGYHSELAQRREDAYQLFRRAAGYAAEAYNNQRAVEALTRCLRMTDDPAQLLDTYRELGLIHEITGNWVSAQESLTYALGLTVLTAKPLMQARLLSIMGRIQQRRGANTQALESLQRAYSIAEELQQQQQLMGETSVYMGRASWAQGEFQAALEHLHRGQEHSRSAADPRHHGLGLYYEGVVLRDQSHYAQALEVLQRSQQELDTCGDTRLVTYPLYDTGIVHMYQGRLQESRKSFEHVYRVYQEIGYRSGSAAALLNLGVLEDRRGDFQTAIDIFQRSRVIAAEIGEQLAVAYALFSIGASWYKLDSFHKGQVYLSDSLRMLRRLQAKGYYGYPLAYLASLFARTAHADRTIRFAALHYNNIADIGSDVENGRSAMAVGIALSRNPRLNTTSRHILADLSRRIGIGDTPDTAAAAEAYLTQALQIAESAHYIDTLIPAHFHLARLYRQQQRDREFRQHLQTAYRLARESTWLSFTAMLEEHYAEFM